MFPFISWYVTISLVGLIIFPLAFRWLRFLPDRGYTLARPLGWLVWGYFFWIGTSFRISLNNTGGLILALAVMAGISYWAVGGARGLRDCIHWLRSHLRMILAAEGVFLAAFALWAFVRAMMPDISGTEKPMELAFINGILTSPGFPPHDPWLSGYAISYYYFGYILIAVLARFTQVGGGVAFNLGIALLFALSALGAYGVLYNLLSRRQVEQDAKLQVGGSLLMPILGPIYLLVVSNLEGFLEVLHARGLFWQQNFDGTWLSGFWRWLGILELDQPPSLPFSWAPSRPGGVLWWRASRVLADYGFDGSFREVIDEFPFFSYLLGDLHPHVLAMPFALLAVGMTLNFFLAGTEATARKSWFRLPLRPGQFFLTALVLGGMSFLNTWDFPIYIVLFCGAYVLFLGMRGGWRWSLLGDFVKLAVAIGLVGGLLYLPFYLGFSSQAGGILPSLIFFTRGTQYWVMFAPLLVPVFVWLVYQLKSQKSAFSLWKGLGYSAILVAGLWISSYLFAGLINTIERTRNMFLLNQGAPGTKLGMLLVEATINRIQAPGAWITLVILLGLTLTGIFAWKQHHNEDSPVDEKIILLPANEYGKETVSVVHSNQFVFLLVLVGGLLTLVPEFFYLLDQFGGRMNTIFKFYYQAWVIWSIAAAYGTVILMRELVKTRGLILRIALLAVLAAGLVYAPVMLANRTNGYDLSAGLTLDGLQSFRTYNPDDAAVIDWLSKAPPGVVAEAVGGQYSSYARIATQTGLPNVIGWPGHESQWRGGDKLFASRAGDIERLYVTNDWAEAESILNKYSIRYIVISGLERSTYRVNEIKFQDHLQQAFTTGNAVIYTVPAEPVAITME